MQTYLHNDTRILKRDSRKYLSKKGSYSKMVSENNCAKSLKDLSQELERLEFDEQLEFPSLDHCIAKQDH